MKPVINQLFHFLGFLPLSLLKQHLFIGVVYWLLGNLVHWGGWLTFFILPGPFGEHFLHSFSTEFNTNFGGGILLTPGITYSFVQVFLGTPKHLLWGTTWG